MHMYMHAYACVCVCSFVSLCGTRWYETKRKATLPTAKEVQAAQKQRQRQKSEQAREQAKEIQQRAQSTTSTERERAWMSE